MVDIPKASRRRVSARAAGRRKSGAASSADISDKGSPAASRGAVGRKRVSASARDVQSTSVPKSGSVSEHLPDVLDLRKLSTDELHEVMQFCVQEIRDRRLQDQDIETIIDTAFEQCFTREGIATMPAVISGFVAVPGSVLKRNASGTKHECNLFTVRINDEDRWSWDFSDIIVENRTFTDGDLRKSIALYPAIDGMLIFGHDRKKSQKSGSKWPVHTYRAGGVRSLRLVMESETEGRFDVASSIETRKLPMPSGIEEG